MNENDVLNFRRLSDNLLTSGQPTRDQFSFVRDLDCSLVVNLAMPDSEGFLPDEREVVESLGMKYVALPIFWDSPQLDDARQLFDVLQSHSQDRVLVHCAKNMRVSALMFVYQTQFLKIDEATALCDLHAIWTPNAVWQSYIAELRRDFSTGAR